MIKPLNKGISSLVGIFTILICVLLAGGVLVWQLEQASKKEIKEPEVKAPEEVEVKEEVTVKPLPPKSETEETIPAKDEFVEKLKLVTLQGPYRELTGEYLFLFADRERGTPNERKIILTMLFRKNETLPYIPQVLEKVKKNEMLPYEIQELERPKRGVLISISKCLHWPETVPQLINVLKDGRQSENIRWLATSALRAIGDRSATPELIEILEGEESIDLKRIILLTLADLKDPRSIQAVRTYLNHENKLIQISAAAALAELGDQRGINIVIEASRSEDKEIQWSAIYSLPLFDGTEALQRLEELAVTAETPYVEVLLELTRVRELPTAKVVEYWQDQLKDPDSEMPEMYDSAAYNLAFECGDEGRTALKLSIAGQEPDPENIAHFYYACAVYGGK